jgi:protein TonB
MEYKKKPELELARKYALFLNMGLIISLSLCLLAFEWKTYPELSGDKEEDTTYKPVDDFVMVDIPPIPAVVPPPATVVPKPPQLAENLSNIIEDALAPQEVLRPDVPDVPEVIPAPAFPVADVVPEEVVEDPVVDVYALEKEPEGRAQFYAYISKHLKYPKAAQHAGVEGKVFVQFVIDKAGSITDVQVIKGLGFGMDEEALRVIRNAPKWMPGKQRGKPVRVRMALPVIFKLH